ncbi:hypothetical protein HDA32_000717 [Spinactinospora alkalitolerans]|uniref:DUF4307 domain-containing protein n=1 Tax=Spinactinospora alkalitolerans TaxID=687207 RepID=A0A852TQM7_9ACTN|nr:DUF4307 domain-containing protein [Spinactinospora alkalitolerans]NYE45597.1 hypothetical protein [Spinactinospora alkalitolerans]
MPSTPSRSPETPPDTAAPAPGAKRRLGNRPVFFFMGLIVAAVFTVGWGFALLSYSGSLHQVSYQTIAWNVVSDTEAEISFQVNSPSPALCLVTATDGQHVQVGQTEVAVPPGVQDTGATIETVRRASAVQVVSCREQGSESESTE